MARRWACFTPAMVPSPTTRNRFRSCPTNHMEKPTPLTVAQAARALGMSERTLRRRVADGKIEAFKDTSPVTGRAWFIEQATVDALLKPPPQEDEQEKEEISLVRVEPRERVAQSAELDQLREDVQNIKAFLVGQACAESGEELPANLGTVIGQAMRETLAPLMERIEEQSAENALLKQQLAQALERCARAEDEDRASARRGVRAWWPFSRRHE